MIEDDRARLPFALLGVVFLVSSVTLTAAVDLHEPTKPATERALEGATAESATVLRGAADDAAAKTAATPVTTPANTTPGRALSTEQPFRDALRLRLYLAAKERLDRIEVRRGDVTATASLPAVEPTTEGYREAIERVRIEQAGEDGAALRVTVEGVTLTAIRDGRTVERVERDPTFVVSTPALLLHDRTTAFESRLKSDVTDPGLDRRLTARLYPIAWARGLAQYGGAPISTVVGTRHVELATNDALLAEQRAVLGASDPDGELGVAAAGRRVATTDLLVGVGGDEDWTDAVLSAADEIGPDPPDRRPVGTWREPPGDEEITVAVESSADRAYASVVGIDGNDDVARLLETVHTVEANVVTEKRRLSRTERGDESPGDEWNRTGVSLSSSISLSSTTAGAPSVGDEWSIRNTYAFEATETRTTNRTWERGNETKTTSSTVETRYLVRIAVVARTAPIDGVPPGRLDGALSDATERATTRVLEREGGPRSIARDAVRGTEPTPPVEVVAEPRIDREEAIDDLADLRDRTRDVSVAASSAAVGVGRTNPYESLRVEIDDRRDDFLGKRGTTPGDRLRLAVRTAYLDVLESELEGRADAHRETSSSVDSTLEEHVDPSRLDGALAAHRAAMRPDPDPPSDPAGDLDLEVESAPPYLPTTPVSRDRIDVHGGGEVTALATRNVNVFTSPHGQLAESLVDRLPWLGTDRVSLSTAASTLRAVEGGETEIDGEESLRNEVADADAYVRNEVVAALVDEGVSLEDAEEAVESDASPAERALALANGSATDRIVDRIESGDGQFDPGRLRIRVGLAVEEALSDDAARPSRPTTNAVAEAAREHYRDELESIVADGVEDGSETARKQLLGERMGSLPAGLPLLPVPGYWYATANVWYVEAAGTYERFALRADRGHPPVTYVRDGGTAWLEHAGERTRLGTADRISFRASTLVVVVVPPGGSGVGDTDGVVDERSPGWPHEPPGAAGNRTADG